MKVILGVKKGMTQLFDEKGVVVPVTVIDCSNVKYLESKPYGAGVFGIQNVSLKRNATAKKSVKGQYKQDLSVIKEVRDADVLENDSIVNPNIFVKGEKVSTTSEVKGRGFMGVMRAHGMSGLNRTHGQSTKPRSIGSIAPGQTWAHVMKGRKMAKKDGAYTKTTKNLRIIAVDTDNNLLFVKGAVSGMKNSLVIVKSLEKK